MNKVIEYQMPKLMAKEICKAYRIDRKKGNQQKFLVEFVNQQFNLLYPCTKVTLI